MPICLARWGGTRKTLEASLASQEIQLDDPSRLDAFPLAEERLFSLPDYNNCHTSKFMLPPLVIDVVRGSEYSCVPDPDIGRSGERFPKLKLAKPCKQRVKTRLPQHF